MLLYNTSTTLAAKMCVMCKARVAGMHVCLVCRSIVAQLLSNLKETKLKIYKAVFVSAVISSELFKHKGQCALPHIT